MGDDVIEAVPVVEVREGKRPCPVCGGRMRVEVLKGVSIDVCGFHGVWLDLGELERLLGQRNQQRRLRRRIREYKAAAEAERREAGDFAWLLFGILGDHPGHPR